MADHLRDATKKTEFISRDEAAKVLCMACGNSACDPFDCSFYKEMENIPAADVVEVVRCKDCRFSEKNSGFLSCDFFNIWNVKQDGFCSYGEWRIKNG